MTIQERISNAKTRPHGKNSMSKLNYLAACPGFESKPYVENEAAEEGTLLHAVMDAAFEEDGCASVEDAIGVVCARDGVALNEEQHELVASCARVLDRWISLGPISRESETPVKLNGISQGSLDVLLIYKGGAAVLIDWKFGRVPVPRADKNLQGIGYALGTVAAYKDITRIGVIFHQPRIDRSSEAIIWARDYDKHLERLKSVIYETEKPPHQKTLRVNEYCGYCVHTVDCPAFQAHAQRAAGALSLAPHAALPDPASFHPERIQTPEQAALLLVWAGVLEPAFEAYRKRALQIAEENGGRISVVVNGDTHTFEVGTRSFKRSLGRPPEIAAALASVISPAQILGAAKLGLGALEDIWADALVQKRKEAGEKISIKTAKEELHHMLGAHDLISRPDGEVKFLRPVKEAAPQLGDGH